MLGALGVPSEQLDRAGVVRDRGHVQAEPELVTDLFAAPVELASAVEVAAHRLQARDLRACRNLNLTVARTEAKDLLAPLDRLRHRHRASEVADGEHPQEPAALGRVVPGPLERAGERLLHRRRPAEEPVRVADQRPRLDEAGVVGEAFEERHRTVGESITSSASTCRSV